ncbi:sensor histidine kinase [Cellulosimicrobium cellulans]|uniref:sensor histidine kinase n=1 Tax=Cellulosimicrobium cellulans TaxID=1710 RepID=UPI0036E6AE78
MLIALVYLFMAYVPDYSFLTIIPDAVDLENLRSSDAVMFEISSTADILDTLLVASALALAVLIAAGALLGWVVAGRIVKPLAAINDAANRAATGSLDHRVALDGPRDEVQALSETFDKMLSALERSFTAQRRFTANASHELRTPLTTTKTMVDVTLADPRADATDLRVLAERVREVNQSSIQLVDALLDLAHAAHAHARTMPVNLTALTASITGALQQDAHSAGIALHAVTGNAAAIGDPILIRQALTNLVRNALTHNKAGGHAAIHLGVDDNDAIVTVTNTGPPVSTDLIPTLTEPFVRGSGRGPTRGTGHGLGLAIVAAVVDAHTGTLVLEPNPGGGLTATMRLPLRAKPNRETSSGTETRRATAAHQS